MNLCCFLPSFVLFALATLCAADCRAAEGSFAFEQKPDHLVITHADELLATYVFHDNQILRPYFAHVHAPGGIQVTRNQPPIEGTDSIDHPKVHPGIWLAFGDLGGGDFWRSRDRVLHEAFVEQPNGSPGKGSFAVRNRYERLDGTTVCHELGRYTFLVRPSGYLLMWDSTFSADKEFSFGDQEEMGLGVRVASPITVKAGGAMLDSEGRVGPQQIWGKTANWCDYDGVIDGRHVGVSLMADPANFRPSWLHARDYGLLVANPFGRKALTGGEPSQVVVRPGETFRLRYGVLLHADPIGSSPDLKAAYNDFLDLLAQSSLSSLRRIETRQQ